MDSTAGTFTNSTQHAEVNPQISDILEPGKTPFLVVFTDMDGTLIDHHTYSAEPARGEIEALQEAGMPIVCISSKTEVEMRRIRGEEGITDPFVVENGSGVFWSDDNDTTPTIAGPGYDAIVEIIDTLPENLRSKVVTFKDMGVEGVMEATGLNEENAADASNRAATMPFSFNGTEEELDEVKAHLATHALICPKGGRFYSVTPEEAGKEVAMAQVVAHYREKLGEEYQIITMAMGDGGNDAGMICAADIGVVIPHPEKGHVVDTSAAKGYIIETESPGPVGWQEAVSVVRSNLFATAPAPAEELIHEG